ncbi:helix-turn-helix domain-containing protein [Glycomyces sp. A-F 0318]|uniref:helix-turn-helix domain-containing protein n=1 Tax=Glycomyces amatae TaxID=2881355 RepID=UPI001E2FE713|nr:helix-turn-helix transcriptional regulator [Glycomyces amatae]MCD0445597.1 helix-turn-helix domain-containing protein [Glycomyces amatae]
MKGYVDWKDVRDELVDRAGGEEAVAKRSKESLQENRGARLAEIRRSRDLTQKEVAERMGITKGRVSQIEQGDNSGTEVLARYARALGGALITSIAFPDGQVIDIGA